MSWVAKAELVALGAGITPFSCTSLGLQGLQVYRLHREERPNYRLRCLQWLNRQPQWPQWGWNQVSCPCSWQQGLWDLRFQPISIGNTSFLSFGAHPLSPISPPTNPLVIPDLSLPGSLPEPPPCIPAPTTGTGPEYVCTCHRLVGPRQQAAVPCFFLAWRRVLQVRALGRASPGLDSEHSLAVWYVCPTEILPPPSLELSPLLCQRPGLGTKPSSGTQRKKSFVPLPSQLLPLSGH